MKRFNGVADYIGKTLQNDTNYLSMVNDKIYEACSTKKKRDDITCIPVDKKDLNSHNFRAITEANLRMYNISIQRNNNLDQAAVYYTTWESTLAYAAVKEREEYNTKVNISWQFTSKNNPKKLWKMIDYDDKGLKSVTSTYSVTENLIPNYFSDVFQAKRLEENPTVADIKHTSEAYNVYIPVMDDDFILDELNDAIQNNGRVTGLDSIDKRIAVLFTLELRYKLLQFFNHIFNTQYPIEWTKQLLRPEKKKGHTENEPKLRSIAISQLLPTLYDIILFNRFILWYSPNPEQAGFRPRQGCLFQIFSRYVVMEFLRSVGKCLYIGFLDFEKAFDFLNRANIIEHLKEKGGGSKFIKAVASMYEETFYFPILYNRMGKVISAKHGVTQGRQTSTSFFSFEVREMPNSINVP